jgi:hypothetical protein
MNLRFALAQYTQGTETSLRINLWVFLGAAFDPYRPPHPHNRASMTPVSGLHVR